MLKNTTDLTSIGGTRILTLNGGVTDKGSHPISRTVPDTTAPTVSSAAVANSTPTIVNLTMSEAMDTGFVPAASAFTVSGHTVSSVAISGSTINLTCSAAFVNGEAARTVGYTQPGTNNARDVAGNLLVNFSAQAITNNVAAVATGVTMTGPTSGNTSVASTNFTVGVTPVSGTITGTVVVTPSDSAGGGTFTPTTVSLTTGSPTGTFTYTPASAGAKTISVTNNGSLTSPSNITYTASSAAATAIVVSGPSSGLVGAASTNFTASANGVITGTVVITPAATGCTFTPATVSISSGAPTATFTCTPAASGAKTISFANNGSLTNQASLTYTATAVNPTVTLPAPLCHAMGGLPLVSVAGKFQFLSKTDLAAAPLANVSKTTDATGNVAAWTQAGLTAGTTVCMRWISDADGHEGYYDVTPA